MKVVLVASGKGGTGKTTTTAWVGHALAVDYKVALLDLDVTGPNLAQIAGVDEDAVREKGTFFDEDWYYPIPVHQGDFPMLEVFSPSFLIPPGCAVAWSGNQRQELIHELLTKVRWHDPDILLCDSPPGTGDEILAVVRNVPAIDGVLVVTNGKREALDDARRLASLFTSERYRAPILGVVENMAYMELPGQERVPLFSDELDIGGILGLEVLERIPYKPQRTVFDYARLADRIADKLGLTALPGEEP